MSPVKVPSAIRSQEGFMSEHGGPRAVELAVFTDPIKLQALRDTPACQQSFCNSSRTHRNQVPQSQRGLSDRLGAVGCPHFASIPRLKVRTLLLRRCVISICAAHSISPLRPTLKGPIRCIQARQLVMCG